MTLDLRRYADQLRGDPTAYFVHYSPGGALPLVIRHETGRPEFVVNPDETLTAFDPANPLQAAAVSVRNPAGFTGHPEHDRSDPIYSLATHGIPEQDYFVEWDNAVPLAVEHATGLPRYALVGGKHYAYEDWVKAGRPTEVRGG